VLRPEITCLSDCQTIAEVFYFVAKEAESSIYSGLVLKNKPEEIQDLAKNYLQGTILFERREKLLAERDRALAERDRALAERDRLENEMKNSPSLEDLLNECIRQGVTLRHLKEAGVLQHLFDCK